MQDYNITEETIKIKSPIECVITHSQLHKLDIPHKLEG